MFALIYDEHELEKPEKKVLSTHRTRETAEAALEKRKKELGREVWECNTRIVWIEKKVKKGETVIAKEYANWKPGEDVPFGETHSDTD